MTVVRPVLLTVSCALLGASACADEGEASPYLLDDVLRLNHVQAKGTHNSYHVEPDTPFEPSQKYTQLPLEQQLEQQGVRQFELDLHYRKDIGFEVFHVPVLDEKTTCKRLVDCLGQVKRWSDDNRWHVPIMIWLEPKDDPLVTDLLPIAGRYHLLEQEILAVFPRSRILAPDDVRGAHADLPSAIAAGGWPTLGALRGKVVFSLLDSTMHRDNYTADAPNLAGKLLFVDASDPKDPFAAMFKVNNAQAEATLVHDLVVAGFIVTSNVDAAGDDPATNAAKLAASLAAGIHYGSSDFPAPVAGGEYWFDLPGGAPARCNPVFPAQACTAGDIERLP